MFKNLTEIVSGKRSRQLRVQEPVISEAAERFWRSKLADVPMAEYFLLALGVTTETIIERMLLESKVSFLAKLCKSLDAERVRDLAAFVSWWAVMAFEGEMNELATEFGDANYVKSPDQLLEIASNVRDTMYPLTGLGQKAVEAYHNAEARLLEGAGVRPTAEAVRIAVGLEPVDFDNETVEVLRQVTLDDISLGAIFVESRSLLVNKFDEIVRDSYAASPGVPPEKTDDERAREAFDRVIAQKDAFTDVVYERYLACKTPLLDECLRRVSEEFNIHGKRAEELAAIASNVACRETYGTQEGLAPFSDEERHVVSAVAVEVAADEDWLPLVAETAWWLAQFIVSRDFDNATYTAPVETVAYSLSLLQRAIELRPDEARFYGTAANTCIAAKDFQSAYEWASKAVALDPTYVEGYRLKGHSALGLGRWDEGAACFEQGLALNPQEVGILAARAELQARRGY